MVPIKAFTSRPASIAKTIDFELDGETYEFVPPKQSMQLVAMMQVKGKGMEADLERVGAMFSWLSVGLNREHDGRKGKPGHEDYVDECQACKIQARLEDPDDNLEVETVMDMITWLMGEAAGRPTT